MWKLALQGKVTTQAMLKECGFLAKFFLSFFLKLSPQFKARCLRRICDLNTFHDRQYKRTCRQYFVQQEKKQQLNPQDKLSSQTHMYTAEFRNTQDDSSGLMDGILLKRNV